MLASKSCSFMSPATALAAQKLQSSQQEQLAMRPAALSVRPAAFAGDVHDSTYYGKCVVGGILSCGLTHLAITPLDLIKCRLQAHKGMYKGIFDGFGQVVKTAGYGGLTLGWLPTLLGYSAQGACKFGFYELFKDVYANAVGPEAAYNYRTYLYLAASASAEVIADVALCPFESIKVRVQTSLPGTFPTAMGAAAAEISKEGTSGFFKGLAPLWMRQVPYTMVKFACFERTVEFFYRNVFTQPKDTYSKSTQLGVTFASGYIAGVFCAVVSHPADTIVSKLNQSKGGSIGSIISELGFSGIWRGLTARIIMVGTLTGLQWWIYDTFKAAVGLQTSGGGKK